MKEGWAEKRLSRRTLLQGALTASAGLAAALTLGCETKKDKVPTPPFGRISHSPTPEAKATPEKETLKILWQIPISRGFLLAEERSRNRYSPSFFVGDDSLFFHDPKGIPSSLKLKSGAVEWQWQEKGQIFGLDEKSLYVVREDKRIYALDRQQKEPRWKFIPEKNQYLIYIPVLNENRIYAVYNNDLLVFNAESGVIETTYNPGGFALFENVIGNSIIYKQAPLFLVDLAILDKNKMQFTLQANTDWFVEVIDNLLIAQHITKNESIVFGFNLETGQTIWQQSGFKEPKVVGEKVSVLSTSDENNGAILNPTDGAVLDRWSPTLGEPIAATSNMIYTTNKQRGIVWGSSISREISWQNDEVVGETLIWADDKNLLLLGKGFLYILDGQTGIQLDKLAVKPSSFFQAIEKGQRVVFSIGEQIFSFDQKTRKVVPIIRLAGGVRLLSSTDDLVLAETFNNQLAALKV